MVVFVGVTRDDALIQLEYLDRRGPSVLVALNGPVARGDGRLVVPLAAASGVHILFLQGMGVSWWWHHSVAVDGGVSLQNYVRFNAADTHAEIQDRMSGLGANWSHMAVAFSLRRLVSLARTSLRGSTLDLQRGRTSD